MQLGVYQNAAALQALDRWQQAIAHNLSASGVSGYRRTVTAFRLDPAGEISQTTLNFRNRPQQTLFPAAFHAIDYTQGSLVSTGRQLDVALEGDGFLQVRRSDGTTAYTRAGSLYTRADRVLVDQNGYEVLGPGGAPLQLSATVADVTIAPDGTISQGETVVGQLAVVTFSDNRRLIPLTDGYFQAPSDMPPLPAAETLLRQGYLEESNATPIRDMIDLIAVSRAYQASQKVITTRDDLQDRALRTLG